MKVDAMQANSKRLAALVLGICLSGCADNVGKWPLEQVEAKVLESLNLAEISLQAADEPGVFRGVGAAGSGETFELTVWQDEAGNELRWEARGDRGTTEVGSYGLE